MNKLIKVSMNLTEKDLENVEYLKEHLKTKSRADTVSAALSMVSSLLRYKQYSRYS